MKIIQATVAHLDKLVPLFDGYRVFYKQPSDPEKARGFLAERIENGESVIFAAEDDNGALLGFTQLYPLFSSVAARPVWLLNDLYVAPDARRRGVARALMNAARAFGEKTGVRGIALETGIDNTQAQALYEDLGYVKQEGTWWYFLGVD